MPVQKYRSLEDMPQAALRPPLDPGNLELACQLSAVAARLARRRFPPGVHRYRSVAAASERRESWERSASVIKSQIPNPKCKDADSQIWSCSVGRWALGVGS